MTRYRVTYKGELIVAGEPAFGRWMAWHGIKPAPEFDMDAVRERLDEIYRDDRVHYEEGSGAFRFPPAYRVEKDDSLT